MTSSAPEPAPRAVTPARARPRTVAVVLVVALLTALLQTASAAPARPYAAPGDLRESAVTSTSMQVSWAPVPGAPGYKVRAYSSGNPTLYFATTTPTAKLTKLKKNTLYYLRAFVEQPAVGSTGATTLSDNSPEIQVTTSTYSRRSPDGLEAGKQTPTSVALSWNPVGDLRSGDRYLVEYALDSALTDQRKTAGPYTGTSTTLGKLANNTSYFAKVYVVDASGKRISGSSDFVTAKSLVPRGTIAGRVSGAPTGDLMAVAYDSANEVAGQAGVRSDGSYSLDVRPGTLKVQVQYVGPAGYTSRWATTGSAGSVVPSRATSISVTYGATANAPAVTLGRGATVTGAIVDPSGDDVRDVDVTALSADTAERVVVDVSRTSTGYTLEGLPDGRYWLRFVYSGDGFRTRSLPLTLSKGEGRTVRQDASLENEQFRSRYKAYVSGTKKVGQTLTVRATPWLAGSYPTTRATMSYQWLRDGVAITGATKTTYQLTSADKGRKISARATARRYGYATGSATSTAYAVS